ncbi:LexA family transcriptional regulator [Pseudomonas sp. B26(2017)]|uniref:LexA family protein n=1 Tax=Pseudomonas sp. B26(2017) TaxID=1981732 RepID=UPI000A1D6961|nr:S24 family peptidase [Pseudomonas sp. B26(2017)]
MTRPDRIATAIKHSRKLKKDIARECGVSPSAVTQWVTGDSKSLRPENLFALAQATGVSAEWLANGTGDMESVPRDRGSNVEPVNGPLRYHEYPEISWVQAGMPVDAIELGNVEELRVHPSDALAGPKGFWLRVNGPSMTAMGGMSFAEGMIILVAPDQDVKDGNYVLAKLVDSNEPTFKQLIRDSGRTFLKALNPSFPTIELDDKWIIVGKVIDAKWPSSALA